MKLELPFFIVMICLGLGLKKIDWRGQFFLFLFVFAWVMYNWKRG